MSDAQKRLGLELLPNRLLDLRVRRIVHGRSCFAATKAASANRRRQEAKDALQDDDARILDESASETDETSLADAEVESLVLTARASGC